MIEVLSFYLNLDMPTILIENGFRFYFYSGDGEEPCHIHVKKGNGDGKIWLEPDIDIEYIEDFKNQERTKIREIVNKNREYFILKWYEYFER